MVVAMSYHSRAERLAASLPKDRALASFKETDKTEKMRWTERVLRPGAGMVINQIMMERANGWVWHDKPGGRQPTEPTQPTSAAESLRHTGFTPEAIGTWAAKQKTDTVLCQAYQHSQCANNPCPMGTHICAIVLRASGHNCSRKHPACMHRWDIKQAKQDCWHAKQLARLAAGGADNSSQTTVGQKQQTAGTMPLQQSDRSSLHAGTSRSASTRPSSAPHVTPPQGTTDGTEIEAV